MSKKFYLQAQAIWLFEYIKVLSALKADYRVVGRGKASALLLKEKIGIEVIPGGINNYINSNQITDYDSAIVAVNTENILEVTEDLINAGMKHI